MRAKRDTTHILGPLEPNPGCCSARSLFHAPDSGPEYGHRRQEAKGGGEGGVRDYSHQSRR
jgi:hypothetical protein